MEVDQILLARTLDVFEKPERILFLAGPKKAVIVFQHLRPGDSSITCRLQAVDLQQKKLEGSIAIGEGVSVLALSPDLAPLLVQ